jgi:hypothetical protein
MVKKKPDVSKVQKMFEQLGVVFDSVSGNEAHAEECPSCGGSKFSLNVKKGMYQCLSKNSFGITGNAITFMRLYYDTVLSETRDRDLFDFKKKRFLPLQTVKRWGVAFDLSNRCYIIPAKDENGEVQNLLQYHLVGGRKYSLAGMATELFGIDQLEKGDDKTLLLVEGGFDAMAANAQLRSRKTRKRYNILTVPGAASFKTKWLSYLKDQTTRCCFDKDQAERDGQQNIAKLLGKNNTVCDFHGLIWPQEYPEKCDLSDLIKQGVSM